ncbi:hypothetical protein [Mechercharimyces sp. CAU 1602]|uniref:hypothetical protein n=1 Tax=Mechercharimyces sp. CAU 1602 TaxID=2973933 RepID=UPI002161D79E|nr:hypothetical protein [Mechercharimyces sp. CAU 1602]MCS1351675.1 hypothetical protein [Mechercharimyces sp. CAU 1602]
MKKILATFLVLAILSTSFSPSVGYSEPVIGFSGPNIHPPADDEKPGDNTSDEPTEETEEELEDLLDEYESFDGLEFVSEDDEITLPEELPSDEELEELIILQESMEEIEKETEMLEKYIVENENDPTNFYFDTEKAKQDGVLSNVLEQGKIFNEFAEDSTFTNQDKELAPSINKAPGIYGNWCGPKHGGKKKNSPKPIDTLDSLCMNHDLEYAKWGYFNCTADRNLLWGIVRKYPKMKSREKKMATTVYSYFRKQMAVRGCKNNDLPTSSPGYAKRLKSSTLSANKSAGTVGFATAYLGKIRTALYAYNSKHKTSSVTVYLQRKNNGKWKTVGHTKVTTNGKYKYVTFTKEYKGSLHPGVAYRLLVKNNNSYSVKVDAIISN